MSEKAEEKKNPDQTSFDKLALRVMEFTGTASGTKSFIAFMSEAVEVVDEDEDEAAQTFENATGRLQYLVGKKSAYRDLKRAAIRALKMAQGVKPPEAPPIESAKGGLL